MSSDTGRILVFDPQIAGVSGDMIIGALLDLGANAPKVIEAMRTPMHCVNGCSNLEIKVGDTTRNGISAKSVRVDVTEEIGRRTGAELVEALTGCLRRLELTDRAKQYALDAVNTIVSAEAMLHGQEEKEVHLHETASADTLADIIGTAVALDDLGLFANTSVFSTPIAIGGGQLHFSHGMVSSPAPAALEILRSGGLFTVGGPVEAELATPTGASLLTALSPEPVRFYPLMRTITVGYGAGTKTFTEMPNVLRVVLGESIDYGLVSDEVCVIESNLDDTTGEVIGYTADRLLHEGARDVSILPMFAKKGRPGYTIRIIADRTNAEHLSSLLIEETGTLGVRIYRCERRVLSREFVPVDMIFGNVTGQVNVKVSRTAHGRIIRIKPEFDDLMKMAQRTGKPLREIEELVRKKAMDIIQHLPNSQSE